MVIARYVIAAIWGAYLLAWVLAVLVLVVLVVVLLISRGPSDTVRGAFRRAVAASQGGSLHAAGRASSPVSVAAAVEHLRAADPRFDATAFLDGARVAVGAYAMALSAQDDRLLRRYATPGYWQSTSGKEIAAGVAEWRRHAGGRPGSSNQGRVLLDVSWREPQVWNVTLGEQGVDRITVRLAAVMIGAIRHGWQRLEAATHADWEFVRPTGQQTDPGAVMVPRTCHRCGAPYRSDLDDACSHCGAPRPDTQAGWRLDRT